MCGQGWNIAPKEVYIFFLSSWRWLDCCRKCRMWVLPSAESSVLFCALVDKHCLFLSVAPLQQLHRGPRYGVPSSTSRGSHDPGMGSWSASSLPGSWLPDCLWVIAPGTAPPYKVAGKCTFLLDSKNVKLLRNMVWKRVVCPERCHNKVFRCNTGLM